MGWVVARSFTPTTIFVANLPSFPKSYLLTRKAHGDDME